MKYYNQQIEDNFSSISHENSQTKSIGSLTYCCLIMWLFVGLGLPCHLVGQSPSIDLKKTMIKIQSAGQDLSAQDSFLYFLDLGLKQAKAVPDAGVQVKILTSLSNWYRTNYDLERAEYYLNGAKEVKLGNDSLKWKTVIRFEESYMQIEQNDFQASLASKKEALRLAQLDRDSAHIFLAALQIAEILIETKNVSEEVSYYLSITEKIPLSSPRLNARYWKAQGDYKYLRKYYKEAIDNYNRAIEYSKEKPDVELLRDTHQKLADIYVLQGNYSKANDALKIYINYRESEINRVNEIAKYTMRKQIDNQANKMVMDRLESERELARFKSDRNRTALIWSLISLLAIIVFSIIIINLYGQRRRADKKRLAYKDEMAYTRSRFYTNITHEFRTPLTVILGMTSKIENHEQATRLIKRNAEQLLQLITQLLDLSKSESGYLTPSYRYGDVIAYIRYLSESFVSIAALRDISLIVYAEDPVIFMDYDPDIIKHIAYNLISNAIKYSNPGGVVTLHLKKENQELLWKTIDNGIGIENDLHESIFDRWVQGSTQSTNGSGIGLAIVKEMTTLLGGEIVLDKTIKRGTTIIISLPISNVEYSEDQDMKASGSESLPTRGMIMSAEDTDDSALVALIIDDNKDVRTYIGLCLEKQYSVIESVDGQEGFDLATLHIPDVIITDAMMPIVDGYQLSQMLKKDNRTSHIPIIMISALNAPDDKKMGISKGVDAYLIKPFDEEELLLRCHHLISSRQQLALKYQLTEEFQIEKSPDRFINTLESHIQANFSRNDYKVEDMAKDMAVSRMQLYRKLKATTDTTPAGILRQFRLRHSKQLLSTTELTISEIAYESGFSDPSHFSRIFTRSFKTTPSEYRNS